MKKRLLRNLLILGLLLVALTAAVSAQYTADVNGKKVRTNILIEYFCNSCGKTHALEDSDYTINSFQARTADGTAKPLTEWKYGDGLVLSASVKATTFTACPQETNINAQTFDSVVIEAAHVGYYCHKQFAFIIVRDGDFRPSTIFSPQSTMRQAPALVKKMATNRSAGSAPAAASVLMQSIQPRQT